MNILFLTHRIPYPPNKGDKIRSFNEIKYLSQKHKIYLGTILDDKSDARYLARLDPYCEHIHSVSFNKKLKLLKSFISNRPFSVNHFYHPDLQQFVDKTLTEKNIDAVICFSSCMAEYIFSTPRYQRDALNGIKLIMDYVDLDSDKWAQYASYVKFPLKQIYRLEQQRLSKYEIKINEAFDESIFVAQREVEMFKWHHPKANGVLTVPNGLDTNYFKPKKNLPENDNPVLVFTGVMDYFANVEGTVWFCNHVLNKIRLEYPRTRFYIVGMRPTRAVRNLARLPGVTVTGFIDDIRKYYWMADVCVIPLRIARGLQNKVLEAMATGNAVVATSNAKNGIICKDNVDILIADDENAFAQKVLTLLRKTALRKKIGKHAVENIQENYSWEKHLQKLEALL